MRFESSPYATRGSWVSCPDCGAAKRNRIEHDSSARLTGPGEITGPPGGVLFARHFSFLQPRETRRPPAGSPTAFEREGFSVWWDQTLHSGENYDQVTERRCGRRRPSSCSGRSTPWIRAGCAPRQPSADRAGTLVPAMIEPCNRPIMFELKHTAELAHWKGEPSDPAWKVFVADVRRFVRRAARGAVAGGRAWCGESWNSAKRCGCWSLLCCCRRCGMGGHALGRKAVTRPAAVCRCAHACMAAQDSHAGRAAICRTCPPTPSRNISPTD